MNVHGYICFIASLAKFGNLFKFEYLFIYFFNSIGAIGVAMVEIDAGTIIEMEVVLDLIGVILMVGTEHVHTESFHSQHFMYYDLWSEGFVVYSWLES